jgi:LemA protein
MSAEVLVALLGVLVLGFWVLGAYNRLVELRNTTADAWAEAAEVLRRRGDALAQLLGALHEPLAAEAASLATAGAALDQAARATLQMTSRPLRAENAAAWVDAETRLISAASRIFALVESAGDLAEQAPVAAAIGAWREAAQRLAYTRQRFNDAATAHDEALRAFPTSLLVGLFGFTPAGRV